MNWEDCGFRPGEVHGPAKCPRGACSECDGEHHFNAQSIDPDDLNDLDEGELAAFEAGETEFFTCKHCSAWATMVEVEDEEDE